MEPARPHSGAVFVRYFVELPLPFGHVEEALLERPGQWIPGPAASAANQGDLFLTEVGFGVDHRRVHQQVQLELREPVVRLPGKPLLPLSWRPTRLRHLLPVLEGEVEAAPLGAKRTQLALNATYRPPFGVMGRAADRALLHRVAEATVRDFVERMGRALSSLVAGGPAGLPTN